VNHRPTIECVVGFNYHPKKGGKGLRFEPGDVVAGVPARVVRDLVEQGAARETGTVDAGAAS
jgi:hypothetical protein